MGKATAKTSSKEVKDKKKAREATEEQKKAWRLDRVREPLLDKALEEYGLETSGSKADKAARLDAHFRNTIPDTSKRLDCVPDESGGCGFTGPVTPACLFCGAQDVDPADEKDFVAKVQGAPVATKAPKAEPESEPIAALAKKDDEAIEQPDDAKEDAPADDAKLLELDVAVKRVVEVHAQGVATYWDLGQALLPIFQRQLYLQRRNDDGTPRYRGWTQFLAGEFGGQIAAGHSYRVMDVAKKFDRETAIRIGVAKLSLLVRAKDEALPRLLKVAETTSVKELHETARKEHALHEPGQRETGRDDRLATGKGKSAGSAESRKGAVADAAKRAEARSDNAITVATQLGTVKIPLFVKGSKDKLARKISDDPHGEEVFVNGVVASYSLIIGPNGALELQIVRRRSKT